MLVVLKGFKIDQHVSAVLLVCSGFQRWPGKSKKLVSSGNCKNLKCNVYRLMICWKR